ncbi:MAG: hypothetical protein M0014_15620 [Actinomycetota bacterium]|jgi:hypothetical protein|nr:hypothetical protein [Actinomycetota bacterium]
MTALRVVQGAEGANSVGAGQEVQRKRKPAHPGVVSKRPGPNEPRPFDLQTLVKVAYGPGFEAPYNLLGVPRKWYERHLEMGLTFWEADELASRCSLLPCEVWDNYWDVCAELDSEAG